MHLGRPDSLKLFEERIRLVRTTVTECDELKLLSTQHEHQPRVGNVWYDHVEQGLAGWTEPSEES